SPWSNNSRAQFDGVKPEKFPDDFAEFLVSHCHPSGSNCTRGNDGKNQSRGIRSFPGAPLGRLFLSISRRKECDRHQGDASMRESQRLLDTVKRGNPVIGEHFLHVELLREIVRGFPWHPVLLPCLICSLESILDVRSVRTSPPCPVSVLPVRSPGDKPACTAQF